MEPSPHRQHESHGKREESDKVEPGSIARFKSLAKRLFAVDRTEFQEALEKDERERRAKRGP